MQGWAYHVEPRPMHRDGTTFVPGLHLIHLSLMEEENPSRLCGGRVMETSESSIYISSYIHGTLLYNSNIEVCSAVVIRLLP